MQRTAAFEGQIPLATKDFLQPQRNAMIGIAKLSEAVLGTSPAVDGLVVGPTAPLSLGVRVDPGQIYAQAAVDATAYGAMPADTQHIVVKQGTLDDPLTLAISTPGTSGFAQWYLVQVAFQERDVGAVVLPYYNSANPEVALAGPANSGEQQYTERRGTAVVQLKAGAPAANGNHQRPAADPGWVGLAWVNAINGVAAITAEHVFPVSNAPRIPMKMPNLAKAIGTSVTTVKTNTQLLAEHAGLVTVDVGGFSGTIDLGLPPADAVPGVPMRFVFAGRYITPQTRRTLGYARIVPSGTNELDFDFVYVGPEDMAELVSDGVSKWRWTSARHAAHCVVALPAAQTIPNNVLTAVNFALVAQTVPFWTADQPTRMVFPRHMRFRAQAQMSWAAAGAGAGGARVGMITTTPVGGGNGGNGNGLGRTQHIISGGAAVLPVVGGPTGAFRGDYLQFLVLQDSGSPLTLNPNETWMALESLH